MKTMSQNPKCTPLCVAVQFFIALAALTEVRADNFDEQVSELPTIDITAVNKKVDATGFKSGLYRATFTFDVDANVNVLNFSCVVSDLWIEGELSNAKVEPVPLKVSEGCMIEPTDAASHAGQRSAVAEFKKTMVKTEEGVLAHQSDYRTFKSRTGGQFQQDVHVVLKWEQLDPLKPVGSYKGVVKLISEIPDGVQLPK